jgi:uncharacterized membrane protein YjfL (UPF0719 family)
MAERTACEAAALGGVVYAAGFLLAYYSHRQSVHLERLINHLRAYGVQVVANVTDERVLVIRNGGQNTINTATIYYLTVDYKLPNGATVSDKEMQVEESTYRAALRAGKVVRIIADPEIPQRSVAQEDMDALARKPTAAAVCVGGALMIVGLVFSIAITASTKNQQVYTALLCAGTFTLVTFLAVLLANKLAARALHLRIDGGDTAIVEEPSAVTFMSPLAQAAAAAAAGAHPTQQAYSLQPAISPGAYPTQQGYPPADTAPAAYAAQAYSLQPAISPAAPVSV